MSVKLTFDESLFDHGEPSMEVEVDGRSVGQCLDCAFGLHPALRGTVFREEGGLIHNTFFRINGKYVYTDVPADALDKPVRSGDDVQVVYASSG